MSPLLLRRLSDEQLGSRLASGEAAAFDELYRRYVHRLAAYGSHLLGDAASGDDVAQSALLKAYGALRDGRVPDRVKPWLYRIAHNAAIDLVVRRRELPTGDLPERPTNDAEPVAGALVAALAALPERQRRVYVLRELHGLRIDETASELGLTSSQVEQSLFAARNRLAESLMFGGRLTCVTVQRLSAGPLDVDERRALKTHLRSCADCRRAAGLRGRALGLLPVPSLEWLRGLAALAGGGGAPVAAKVGAIVATASVAVGVPAAVEQVAHPRVQAAAAAVSAPPAAVRPVIGRLRLAGAPVSRATRLPGSAPAASPVSSRRSPIGIGEREHAVEREHARAGTRPEPGETRGDGKTAERGGDGGGGGGVDEHPSSGSVPAAPTETTSGGGDRSGRDGPSQDGSGAAPGTNGDGGGDGGATDASSAPAETTSATTTTTDGSSPDGEDASSGGSGDLTSTLPAITDVAPAVDGH